MLLVILPLAIMTQGPSCPLASGDTVARAVAQVERRPVADPGNASPGYPPLLREAGVQGPVRVAFVVDTTGHVDRATIRIAQSPNPGFDYAVKRAVGTWRYTPALVCGRPARVRLGHEFAFRITRTPKDTLRWAQLFEVDTSVAAVIDTLPDGTPRTTLGWSSTIFVVESVPWRPATVDSAEEAVVAHLVEHLGTASSGFTRIVCLVGKAGLASDPDSASLVRLTRPGIAMLPFRRCPPTFVSMIYTLGQRPLPPGEDPFRVDVRARTPLSSARIVFDVDVAHGAGGNYHRCGAERRDGGWRVHCVSLYTWVS